MCKVISYSLWGDNPVYNHGFMKNYFDAKKIYGEWKVILYYDDSIDIIVKEFIHHYKIESYNMTGINIPGEFWRFLANDINNDGYTIFRDCDSRLSLREKLGVDEWINSGKILHVIRDHPFHKIPLGVNEMGMLAGMWGIKSGEILIKEMLDNYLINRVTKWGDDQNFISSIYKKFNDDMYVHDEFFGGNKFPIPRTNKRFIGERIDENNNPIGDDFKYII